MENNTESTENEQRYKELKEFIAKSKSEYLNVVGSSSDRHNCVSPDKKFQELYSNLLKHNYELSLTAECFEMKAKAANSKKENDFRAAMLEKSLSNLEGLKKFADKARAATAKLRTEQIDLRLQYGNKKNMKKYEAFYHDYVNRFVPMMMKDAGKMKETYSFLKKLSKKEANPKYDGRKEKKVEIEKLSEEVKKKMKNVEQELNVFRKHDEELDAELSRLKTEIDKMEEEIASINANPFNLELLQLERKIAKLRKHQMTNGAKRAFKNPNDFPILLDFLDKSKTKEKPIKPAEKRKASSQLLPSKRSKKKTHSSSQSDHKRYSKQSGHCHNKVSRKKHLPLLNNRRDVNDNPVVIKNDNNNQDASFSLDQAENHDNSLRRTSSSLNINKLSTEHKNDKIHLDPIYDELQNEADEDNICSSNNRVKPSRITGNSQIPSKSPKEKTGSSLDDNFSNKLDTTHVSKALTEQQEQTSISSNESTKSNTTSLERTQLVSMQKQPRKNAGNREKSRKSQKNCKNEHKMDTTETNVDEMIVEEINDQQEAVENNVEMMELQNSDSGTNLMEVDGSALIPENNDQIIPDNGGMDLDEHFEKNDNSNDALFSKSFGELFGSSPRGSQPSNSSFEKFLDNTFEFNDGEEASASGENAEFDFFNFGGNKDDDNDDLFFTSKNSFNTSNEGLAEDMF